jgi:hypothetical protein
MVSQTPPVPNAERQRQFRERNPGYYGRLHARRRAEISASLAQQAAASEVIAAKREPLLLPAPVELLEIPGINAIPATMPVREAVPVPAAREATGKRKGASHHFHKSLSYRMIRFINFDDRPAPARV